MFELRLNDHVILSFQSIPASAFLMGSRDESTEEPIHEVRITRPFYLGTFPVTQREFTVWVAAAKIEHRNAFSGKPNHPAETLDWHQAVAFCQWLNSAHTEQLPEGFVATLPTEAQWEYACRAGTTTDYYTGDGEAALAEAGWFAGNSGGETHAVGELAANGFGLYDMHGNVDEWCLDAYDTQAYRKRVNGVADPVVRGQDVEAENPVRVVRGGSWGFTARNCRSARRFGFRPDDRSGFQGFRVCLVPGPEPPLERPSGSAS